MTDQEFAEVARLLEEAVLELKETNNPEIRRTLLADIRMLLAEADRLMKEKGYLQ